MTKKDYVAIAAIISAIHDDYPHDGAVDAMANRFAEHAKKDNPRFDRDRFIAACGL